MPFPQRFQGDGIVLWTDIEITVSVPWFIGLMFRTRQTSGTLMQVNAGSSSRINIQVRSQIFPCIYSSVLSNTSINNASAKKSTSSSGHRNNFGFTINTRRLLSAFLHVVLGHCLNIMIFILIKIKKPPTNINYKNCSVHNKTFVAIIK